MLSNRGSPLPPLVLELLERRMSLAEARLVLGDVRVEVLARAILCPADLLVGGWGRQMPLPRVGLAGGSGAGAGSTEALSPLPLPLPGLSLWSRGGGGGSLPELRLWSTSRKTFLSMREVEAPMSKSSPMEMRWRIPAMRRSW